MIRVAYHWTLDSDDDDEFVDAWRASTEHIRRSHAGALGSTLLRPHGTARVRIGLARWTDDAHLQAFWDHAHLPPLPHATLSHIEVLEEIDDLVAAAPVAPSIGAVR